MNQENTLLTGQVALVTGGGRGLGRAFAQTLAAAGASVALMARSAGQLAEAVSLIGQASGMARAFRADVADADQVRAAFAEVEQTLGPVDLLVNNAGKIQPLGPIWECDPAEWWSAMEINMRGPLLCCRAALPGMVARRRGRIINIATGVLSIPHLSAYMTSKTALVRFSECLAAELKPHGISVFSVAPGSVRTTMTEYSLDSPQGRKWIPWYRKIFDRGLNLPPERPAQLVLALASGREDALSGLLLSPFEDIESLLSRWLDIERDHLHKLQIRRLDETPNPILLEAQKPPA
jgi:NAD(P)-dependent dehydrogenase (short-subunit alcohol dehydrogenase family)